MLSLQLHLCAVSYHSVNIDKETAAAMVSAYGMEAEMESLSSTSLSKIIEHYRSATVATAGILLSKKKDMAALRNPGIFSSEENYYYKRILNLVKDRIMPKVISVASHMVKQPENAIYWGPYLLKTTENVEQLCKQFEVVCTNGRLSFKDVQFLLINDDLRKVFDLAQMGSETNWKDLLEKLGDFGKDLSKDDIIEDFNNLGALLSQIGKATVDDNFQQTSKIGKIFHMKPGEIADLYDSFKEKYEQLKDGGNVKNVLMQVIGTADADGVARLFKVDSYNVAGYISNYVKELQGEYYTQRWYIAQEESGSNVLCSYTPTSYGNYKDSRWSKAWNHYESPKDDEYCHTLTTSELMELKDKAYSQCGWNQATVDSYNQSNPGHKCTISYSLNHVNFREKYQHGWGSTHYKRHCFYSYSVTVIDKWSNQKEVYEETFDSQTMDLANFKKKMEERLKGYQDEDSESGLEYKLMCDPPRYYMMADEKKMEGCNSVSFTASCSGGASLAQGSFSWKENGRQGNSLTETSREYAMRQTPDSENNNVDDLHAVRPEYEEPVLQLRAQVAEKTAKQEELIKQMKEAKQLEDLEKVKDLEKKYEVLSDEVAVLKKQLAEAQGELDDLDDAISDYYNDLRNPLDGPYRIPQNMQEVEAMYELQWLDAGQWVGNSFIRQAYCPSVKTTVTYSASLSLQQRERHFLGIRVHRAILSVDFNLGGGYSSDGIVAELKLDMSKSEKERADEVNDKLRELMEDMPGCSIKIKYNYANKEDNVDDDDSIHLLWASDRLDVAREIDNQLTSIYSQLIVIEKVMQNRETILDFLKHKILDVVSRAARSTIAEYALNRWEDAGLHAMQKQSESSNKKNDDKNSSSSQ